MKRISSNLIIAAILIIKSFSCYSQKDSSGIYFTANDYILHKLSYAIDCKTEKHSIKADMVFDSKDILIKHKGATYKYSKDSVYGIRHCDGSITRLYHNSEYPIINPYETILIYKVVSGPYGKGSPSVTKYYFSKDAQSDLQEMTIHNLKAAFPDNHKFHDLIDMEFHHDDELITYDEMHKMMKINRILFVSLEK
jgi:hypothetical protein